MMRFPKLNYKENFLRAVNFNYPEYVPCRISISWPVWNTYRIELKKIVPYGGPQDVENHKIKAFKLLSMKRGGLMFIVGIYPPTPLENIKALCEAFNKIIWLNKYYH